MSADSRHDRFFRALLKLFPREFRGDFGDQMAADFQDQREEAAGEPRRLRRLWLATVADLVRRAPGEHLDVVRRETVHALRVLRRHPASTLTAILSLGVGIGLNTAVFSVVYGVLWQKLPLNGERLVVLREVIPDQSDRATAMSPEQFTQLAARVESLEIVTAEFRPIRLIDGIDPIDVAALAVTPSYFSVLGAQPVAGRLFIESDFQAARQLSSGNDDVSARPLPAVAILSYGIWQRRFGGSDAIVGSRVRLAGGASIEIVGVLGPEVEPLDRRSMWVPGALDPHQQWGGVSPIGLLKPGATLTSVNAELQTVWKSLPSASTKPMPKGILTAIPLRESLVSGSKTQLMFLFGAVFLVLLVTCANIVGLFLAQAAGRRAELWTRVALGATRSHLVRQMIIESLVVAVAGGTIGLLLAVWAVPVLVASAPATVPRLAEIGVDRAVLAMTAAMSILAGLLCGATACLPLGRTLATVSVARTTASPQTARFRGGIAIAEIALALMLAVATTLMVRTLQALAAIDLGFDPSQVVAVGLPSGAEGSVRVVEREVVDRLKALPGVTAAGVGIGPLTGSMGTGGKLLPGDDRQFEASIDPVGPGYFEALGARLKAGRLFNADDLSNAESVIVINQTAARTFWGSANPIGRTLDVAANKGSHVIGVIEDMRGRALEAAPPPTIYQLHVQSKNFFANTLLVRAAGDPQQLAPAIRQIVRDIDPESPFRVQPLQERFDRLVAPRRFMLRLTGLFSVFGVMLAVLGIYGVLAESVGQRIPEMGIRLALGATASNIVMLVMRQSAWLVGCGLVLGLAGAATFRRVMDTMVYGVATLDPAAYVVACAVLAIGALAVSVIPARRAATADPIQALRTE